MAESNGNPNYPRRPWLSNDAEVLFGPVDPQPIEVPVELLAPPSLEERIVRMIRQEISRAAQRVGAGTFEEEDDFELEDDDGVFSDYQVLAMAQDEAPDPPADPGEAPATGASLESGPEEGPGDSPRPEGDDR